jgi:hypothetical protein
MTETEVTIERARFCEPSGLDEAIQAARTPAQLVSTIVAAAREMGHERARHLLSLTG